jgi:hypothetical protein
MVANVFEHIAILIYLYLLLAYLGIGIFALITPASFKKPYLYALVSPGFGFCLLAIVGSWVIAANVTVTWAMIVSLLIATGLNLVTLLRANIRRKVPIAHFRPAKNAVFKALLNAILLLGILFLIILPGIRQGTFTTPMRMGPDAIGYAGAAQVLADGGTLSSIAEDLKAVTGEEDLKEAKELNFQLLRFDLHCSSEFLLKALRWGYPTILANMTWVTGLDSVRLDFVILIFSWAMLFGLAYYASRSIIKARWYICSLLAAALALNCNLLNAYYEGSYAQVMATPLLFMLLLCLWDLRKNHTHEDRGSQIRLAAFVGFLCAGLLAIWNEAFILLGIVCFIVLVLDLLAVRRIRKVWVTVFGCGALLAFFLVAPLTLNLSLMVKGYSFTYLRNITAGGWWQPQWATPPEIMGWLNIYAHGSQPNLLPRDSVEVVAAFLGSLLILAAGEYCVLSNKKLDLAFWLAPILFVLLIYAKCVFWDRTINYQYYKAYTAFLPVLFIFIYAALFYLARTVKPRLQYVLYGIIALTIFVTAFGGVSYITKYHEESSYFTDEMSDLQEHSELLDNYVLMTPYGPHYMQVTQIAATFKMNFYNFAFERDYKTNLIREPYLDMPVAIILFDVSDDDRKQISANGDDFIYSGKEFLVVKTPFKLKDGLDEHGDVRIENYFYRTENVSFDYFTKFLLHNDGIDGSTTFRNETKIVSGLTAMGDAHIDTNEQRFGTASGSFDGTGDYLDVANSADFDFGSEDFTIDGWFYFNANDIGYQFMVDRRTNSDGTGWTFFLDANNQFSFLSASASAWDNAVVSNTGVVPATGRWIHMAVVRHGNVFTMYQNGTAIKSGTYTDSIGAQTINPTIGAGHASPGSFNGHMDEFRISKGIARWTADFIPPTAPY